MRRDALALLALALLGLLVASRFFGVFTGYTRDEGSLTQAAYLVQQGRVPYRDFHMHACPVPIYSTWLALEVVGPRAIAPRLGMAAQFLALAGLLYAVARRHARPLPAFLAAATFLNLNLPTWPILSMHWMAAILILAGLLWRQRPVALGAVTGVALFTVQSAAATLLLLFLVWGPRQRWRPFMAGVLGVAVPAGLLLASVGALVPFLYDAFLLAGRHVTNLNYGASLGDILAPLQTLGAFVRHPPPHWPAQLYLLGAAFYSQTLLVVLFGVLVVLIAVAGRLRSDPVFGVTAFYVMLVLSYTRTPVYLNFVFPLLYVCVLRIPRLWRAALALCLVANLFPFCVYAYVNTRFRYPIHFATGTLYTQDEDEARFFNAMQDALARHPQSNVFYTPIYDYQCLAFLNQRPNCTSYFQVEEVLGLPGVDPFAQVLADVRRATPEVLVLRKLDPNSADRAIIGPMVDIYRQITPGYRLVTQSQGALLFERGLTLETLPPGSAPTR